MAAKPREHDNPKNIQTFTDRASAFMEKHVAVDEPFFLQVSHDAVHLPMEAEPETIDKYRRRAPGSKHSNVNHAAMNEDLFSTIRALETESTTCVRKGCPAWLF